MTAETKVLEERVKEGAKELLALTGAASFCLAVKGMSSPLYVAAGAPEQIP